MPVLEIRDLHVCFGEIRAVDGLSLVVESGTMVGLLGPNGAGKTTTISCVAGLLQPTQGSIQVAGYEVGQCVDEVRRSIGVVPQKLALYDELTVRDNLRIFAGLFGLSGRRLTDRVAWALSLSQLESKANERVGTLSGGMKRRLNLAASMQHEPQLLICDEPTTGVDPQSRNHIFEIIRALRDEGMTVVYTTHYMEEVEALCDRVAIVDHGRIIADDSLDVLLEGKESLEEVFLELTGRALRDSR